MNEVAQNEALCDIEQATGTIRKRTKTEIACELVLELNQLMYKAERLENALSVHRDKIPAEHLPLMDKQLEAMKEYSKCLSERIKLCL